MTAATFSRTCDADLYELACRGALVEHCREWFRAQHLATIARRNRQAREAVRRR